MTTTTEHTTTDVVVLVDEDGTPVGVAPRATVHTRNTPLHLAFSCYLFDAEGRVLVTRRALTKRTWPGVWTNSFCGHLRPGEDVIAAARRHAATELGITELLDVSIALPDYRYRAVDASGTVENELCPVLLARTEDPILADPAEVAEHRWITTTELGHAVASAPWALSPWSVEQVRLIAELEIGGPR